MNELLVAGVSPFWGSQHRLLEAADARHFRSRVVRLKRCIWAGLRFSEIARGPGGGRPVTLIGDDVGLPGGGAGQEGFARAVTNTVRVRPARGGDPSPLMFELRAGLVSVLDGFVASDPELTGPRLSAGV